MKTSIRFVTVAILVACSVSTIVSLTLVSVSLSTLPYFDYWFVIQLFQKALEGKMNLADLLGQHMEHRIFIPRLIFLADLYLDSGRNIVPLICIGLIQIGDVLLFWLLLRRTSASLEVRLCAISVIALLAFCVNQADNLAYPFQVQFVGVYFLALGAFVALAAAQARMDDGLRYGALLVAGLFLGACAALTMANGAIVLLTYGAISLIMRRMNRITFGSLAIGSAILALYLANFTPPPGTSGDGLAYIRSDPAALLRFVVLEIGSVFVPFGLSITTGIGICGLALAAALAISVFYRRDLKAVPGIAIIAFLGFIFGSALLTAIGRVPLGPGAAIAGRYVTPSELYWGALICGTTAIWFSRASSPFARLAYPTIAGTCALVLASVALFQHSYAKSLDARMSAYETVSDALRSDIFSQAVIGLAFPSDILTGIIKELTPTLREHKLSIFADQPAKFGDHVSTADAIDCEGTVESFDGIRDGAGDEFQIDGTGQSRNILVVTSQGQVVGFGSAASVSTAARLISTTPRSGLSHWVAFAKSNEPVLGLFTWDGAHRLCRLGTTAMRHGPIKTFPEAADRVFSKVPIEAEVSLHGGWIRDGANQVADAPPAGTLVYGTGVSDQNTGELSYENIRVKTASPRLLLVTGPRTDGLKIELLDAETGDLIGSFEPRPRVTWTALKLDLPGDIIGRKLTLRVIDHGAGWGQWIAVGGLYE